MVPAPRPLDDADGESRNRDLTPDGEARAFAVDPRNNVVLEASAGTGKTSVLVSRYVNLVKQGVEPSNILAITFTRKAAAEMRERIVAQLRDAAAKGEIDRARWTELRDRLGEIAISTIDAFCLSLLREFPLEADLDPGFEMADETEVPRIVEEALDRALRILVGLAKQDDDIGLVLAQLGISRAREGLALLLDRRLVAATALDRFLARGPADLDASPRLPARGRSTRPRAPRCTWRPGSIPGRRAFCPRAISVVHARGGTPARSRPPRRCRSSRPARAHWIALSHERRGAEAERPHLPVCVARLSELKTPSAAIVMRFLIWHLRSNGSCMDFIAI